MTNIHGKLAISIIAYEKLPLSFELEGQVDRYSTGRVLVKLTNYSSEYLRLYSGTPVAGFHKSNLCLPDYGLKRPVSKCACNFQCIF